MGFDSVGLAGADLCGILNPRPLVDLLLCPQLDSTGLVCGSRLDRSSRGRRPAIQGAYRIQCGGEPLFCCLDVREGLPASPEHPAIAQTE